MRLHCHVAWDADRITIRFPSSDTAPSRKVSICAVLDLDQYGEVVAIEMINLKQDGHVSVLPHDVGDAKLSTIEFSYDESADAAYFRLKRSRSMKQRSVAGCLELGENGHLISITVDRT